ncbi:MAG: DUF6538 domain-containing protein [Pseudomonadota bacterium]
MMIKLPRVPGTRIRGCVYYTNIRIPAVLAEFYPGRTHWVRSLKTSNPKVARDKVGVISEDWRLLAQEVAAGNPFAIAGAGVTDIDLSSVDEPFDDEEEDRRFKIMVADHERARQERIRAEAKRKLDAAVAQVRDMDTPDQELLHKLSSDTESAIRRLPAKIEELRNFLTHPSAVPADKYEKEVYDLHRAHAARRLREFLELAHKIGLPTPNVPRSLRSIENPTMPDEVAEHYFKSRASSDVNQSQLKGQWENTLRRWREFHGDLPVKDFRHEHLSEFAFALRSFPASSAREVRSANIHDAIELCKAGRYAPISSKTRSGHVQRMKQLTKHARSAMGKINHDPFADYSEAKEKVKHSAMRAKARVGFSSAQTCKILDAVAKLPPSPHAFRWLPALAAYTAARLEELAQLRPEDVREVSGIPAFVITDEFGTVKNSNSVRVIPIPHHIASELMVLADERRGADRLFQRFMKSTGELVELNPDPRGRYGTGVGGDFASFVQHDLKITGNAQSLHSFRHRWEGVTRAAGGNLEIRRMIAGRIKGDLPGEDSIQQKYGGYELMKEKADYLRDIAPLIRKWDG